VLVADSLVDLVRSYVTPLAQVDLDRLRGLMHDVTEEADKELEPTGLGTATEDHFVQMCYPGQNFDMSVPTSADVAEDDLIGLAERFHAQHERERGFCFRNQPPLIRGVRIVARVATPKPDRFAVLGTVTDAAQARIGSRPAYFGTEFVDTPIYDGPVLAPGVSVAGPALVQEPFTVIVVPPGARLTLDETGNYELHL
jgi:N-methylhydantoinase A